MQGSTVMRQSGAATLATEEPDAFIAHVRICGGAGWVTTGSTRKLDKDHGSIRQLLADDSFGGETQAVAIESQGSFQIIDPEGDDSDAWLHRLALL